MSLVAASSLTAREEDIPAAVAAATLATAVQVAVDVPLVGATLVRTGHRMAVALQLAAVLQAGEAEVAEHLVGAVMAVELLTAATAGHELRTVVTAIERHMVVRLHMAAQHRMAAVQHTAAITMVTALHMVVSTPAAVEAEDVHPLGVGHPVHPNLPAASQRPHLAHITLLHLERTRLLPLVATAHTLLPHQVACPWTRLHPATTRLRRRETRQVAVMGPHLRLLHQRRADGMLQPQRRVVRTPDMIRLESRKQCMISRVRRRSPVELKDWSCRLKRRVFVQVVYLV